MYASTTIANTIISLNPGRTPMAIIKLVYLAHGWSLALKRPVVADLPEYWEFGPVHDAVYDQFRMRGGDVVEAPLPVPGSALVHLVPTFDVDTHAFLKELVEVHRSYTAIQLANSCHAEGTPWALAKARMGRDFKKAMHTTIPEAEIIRFFTYRLDASRARADQTKQAA